MLSQEYYPIPFLLLGGYLFSDMVGVLPISRWYQWSEKRFLLPFRLAYEWSWVKPFHVMCCSVSGSTAVMALVFKYSQDLLFSGIVSVAGWIGPYLILELMLQKARHEQEASLTLMFGILKRWASIHPDLIQCLTKASEEPLSPALRLAIRRLLLSVQRGLPMEKAFDDLSGAVDSGLFKDFVIHLRFFAQSRGDLVKLFESFEMEAFRLQKESMKRNFENRKNQIILYSLNGLAVAVYLMLVVNQAHVRRFYLETRMGLNISAVFALLIILLTALTVWIDTSGGDRT
jgi:hypothetical protein